MAGNHASHEYHEHEHEHHEHAHEHEHEHHEHAHRESFMIPGAEVFVEAHMHDQAATVSMALCPAESRACEFGVLVAAMTEIAKRAESAGGIIGHIKAFARQDQLFAHASVTVADIEPAIEGDSTLAFGEESDIQLVAIVMLIELEELIEICKASLENVHVG